MGDVGQLFTDRKAALRAVDTLVASDGAGRVLLLTGVSGMGKSTVLARLHVRPPRGWSCVMVNAEVLVSGMAVRAEGSEEAALELLRLVGGHLATLAPWWRRRWLRQKAAEIGGVGSWQIHVRQWAGFGGRISHSPVRVTAGSLTQGERRGQWTGQLLAVARAVRRRRLLLLIDTSELLAYFDDVTAEQPRPGRPYGVAGWFSRVLDQLLDQMPGLRVVIAGTTAPAMATSNGRTRDRIVCLELEPWKAEDTRRYLARCGLPVDVEAAVAVTGAVEGLPVEISWIMDILTGQLADGQDPASAIDELVVGLAERAGPARSAWLRSHVLERISDGTLRLLQAAAVLEVFTSDALLTVAAAIGAVDRNAFLRLEHSSYIRTLDGDAGLWRMHTALRRWLLEVARDHDAQRSPPERVLPALHRAAAEHYEALAGDNQWSLRAAHHRFSTGDERHSAAWTARLIRALSTQPLDTLLIQTLADAALTVPDCSKAPSAVLASAHLASSLLHFHHAKYPAARHHAEQALAIYRSLDGHSEAVQASARLAGHAAWSLPRYEDATVHWATAIAAYTQDHGAEHETPDDADGYALQAAMAEAVMRTGNAHRARRLLEALPDTPPDASPTLAQKTGTTRTLGTAVAEVLSAYALPGTQHGSVDLLHARVAYALNEYEKAASYARHLLKDPKTSSHHTALAHNLLARIAHSSWDLDQGGRHTRQGIAAARRCLCQLCLVQLLLTDAEVASRRAGWAPPSIIWRTPAASATATSASSAPTTSISLSQRAESAHQRELSQRQGHAAKSLAAELDDPYLRAQTITGGDPAAALILCRMIGDRLGEANALQTLADGALVHYEFGRAEEHANQALAIYRTIGDRLGEANALRILADTVGSEEHANQALAIYRTIGDRLGEANAVRILADTALRRYEFGRAEEHANRALAIHRTIGDRLGEANALRILADTVLQRDDTGRAEEHANQALAIYRTIDDRLGEANALQTLANTVLQRDDTDRAEEHANQALAMYRRLGNRLGEANALQTLANTALQRNDTGAWRHNLADAASLYEQIGIAREAAMCRKQLKGS